MNHTRAALYLDFDNVFIGLFKLDPAVAIQFASNPGAWLGRLSSISATDGVRRWLILRCYLNPSGWVGNRSPTGEQERLFFSRFRPSFVRAGFEVIDCPRYNATKNGADIRIVIDAIDALTADTHYEEFVIASGDSDMTPLLQRLRRSDRRTMIVSPADAADAFVAMADRVLDSEQLLALVQGDPMNLDGDADETPDTGFNGGPTARDQARDEAYATLRAIVLAEYDAASTPINMAALAQRLRSELDRPITVTNWFGFGSFARALESLDLPNLRMSQHLIWDDARHTPPEPAATTAHGGTLPEPVERLAELLNLPRIPPEWWPPVYQTLADYAGTHQFNLTQCTSWARDQLHDQGVPVSRGAVAFVVRGTSYGGRPLHGQPPPSGTEVGAAFVANVLNRADAAGIAFDHQETAVVHDWLGVPRPNAADPGQPPPG
ncbi:NYN domain-containing protein [Micromonospora sp. LOL_023]|uniref:NYN domain-containing protein n=1 Tax=Micromonospora sp. LOL_023 TaxID=3345418 RepID=UPI003A8A64E3